MLSIKLTTNNWLIIFPLILSVILSFYQLGAPDLNGDEYDLGYQAYNLVDGIFAGRKAYVLSFNGHPPLTMYLQHFTMQMLDPTGLDNLQDWMFRVGPAILGVLGVAIIYLYTLEFTHSRFAALTASSLLAVNNYHLFLSRIFHREGILSFYLYLSFYLFLRFLRTDDKRLLVLTGIFIGAAMLIKAVAIMFLPVFCLILLIKYKRQAFSKIIILGLIFILLFLPVIIYNIGAYITTGYADIFFGRILGTKFYQGHSHTLFDAGYSQLRMLQLFLDQFGPVLIAAMAPSLIFMISKTKDLKVLLTFLLAITPLIFFFVNGIKVYYLSFATFPLVVMLANFLWNTRKVNKLFVNILTTFIFAYCLSFSLTTLFDRSFVISEKYTENYPSIRESLTKHYSKTTRGFLEVRSWKKLQTVLQTKDQSGKCLFIDKTFRQNHNLQIRRYLMSDDGIKKYYLGKNYQPPYNLCDQK